MAICLAGGLRSVPAHSPEPREAPLRLLPRGRHLCVGPAHRGEPQAAPAQRRRGGPAQPLAATSGASKPWSLKRVQFIAQEPLEETEEYNKVLLGWLVPQRPSGTALTPFLRERLGRKHEGAPYNFLQHSSSFCSFLQKCGLVDKRWQLVSCSDLHTPVACFPGAEPHN